MLCRENMLLAAGAALLAADKREKVWLKAEQQFQQHVVLTKPGCYWPALLPALYFVCILCRVLLASGFSSKQKGNK
jgi:hypothetical protein